MPSPSFSLVIILIIKNSWCIMIAGSGSSTTSQLYFRIWKYFMVHTRFLLMWLHFSSKTNGASWLWGIFIGPMSLFGRGPQPSTLLGAESSAASCIFPPFRPAGGQWLISSSNTKCICSGAIRNVCPKLPTQWVLLEVLFTPLLNSFFFISLNFPLLPLLHWLC